MGNCFSKQGKQNPWSGRLLTYPPPPERQSGGGVFRCWEPQLGTGNLSRRAVDWEPFLRRQHQGKPRHAVCFVGVGILGTTYLSPTPSSERSFIGVDPQPNFLVAGAPTGNWQSIPACRGREPFLRATAQGKAASCRLFRGSWHFGDYLLIPPPPSSDRCFIGA
jgi:hypothetical protein